MVQGEASSPGRSSCSPVARTEAGSTCRQAPGSRGVPGGERHPPGVGDVGARNGHLAYTGYLGHARLAHAVPGSVPADPACLAGVTAALLKP